MEYIEAVVSMRWMQRGPSSRTQDMIFFRNTSACITGGVFIGMLISHTLKFTVPIEAFLVLTIITFAAALYAQLRVWLNQRRVEYRAPTEIKYLFLEGTNNLFITINDSQHVAPVFDEKGIRYCSIEDLPNGKSELRVFGNINPKMMRGLTEAHPEIPQNPLKLIAFYYNVVGEKDKVHHYYNLARQKAGKASKRRSKL